MNNTNIQTVKYEHEYTNEELVQKLALLKIQTEISNLPVHEIGAKFIKYCDQIRAYIN